MTAVLWALNALRKLPRWAYGVAACAALVLALWLWHRSAVSDAYQQGKQDAVQGVTFDSAMVARAAEAVALRTAHTDTVWLRAKSARQRLDSAVSALPDSLTTVPAVRAVVTEVAALGVQIDSLVSAHAAERTAWIERARVDSTAIYALRLMNTAQRDTIMTLNKRPRWRTVVSTAVVALAAGLVAR